MWCLVMNNWKVQIHNSQPLYPFIVIDNWYTPEEEKAVWKELDFLSSVPREETIRAENSIVATDNGKPLSKAYRYYLEDYLGPKGFEKSAICKSRYKHSSEEFIKIIEQCLPYGRNYRDTNVGATLISYYEDNDYYNTHWDSSLWTILTWCVKDLSYIDGGDFELPENGTTIKLKNNRTVAFPSCLLHGVTPIKFKKQTPEIGYGKYTISTFCYNHPGADNVI